MRKSIIVIFAIILCLGLVACAKKEAVIKDYPILSSASYMDEAVSMPEIIFTTAGDENGLIGSIFYFNGLITDSGNRSGANYVIIETEGGNLLLSDTYNYLHKTMDEETFNLVVAEDESDYTLPTIGETVHVVATYGGFSEVFKMPSLHLGANSFIVESYREDNPTFSGNKPAKVSESPALKSSDFFSDENRRSKYEELYKSYQYVELLDYLNTYIANENPTKTDTVYESLKYVEPAAQVIEN